MLAVVTGLIIHKIIKCMEGVGNACNLYVASFPLLRQNFPAFPIPTHSVQSKGHVFGRRKVHMIWGQYESKSAIGGAGS